MKLSVSNIAWDKSNNYEALDFLKSIGIKYIDIAPTLSFDSLSDGQADKFGSILGAFDMKVVGMQSLLYPFPNLTLFESKESREILVEYFEKNCRVAKILGIRNLVFGSPKNRLIRENDLLTDYIYIFRKLSDIALIYDCLICFEPNPVEYGCNFMTKTKDAINFIRKVDHESFKLNLDVSTTIINGENFDQILNQNTDIVEHIHISSPGIKDILHLDNRYFSESIRNSKYDKFVTLECLLSPDSDLKKFCENVECFKKNYN